MSESTLPVIDIDNPDYQPAADPVEEATRLARHAAARAPFLDEFFWAMRDKLALTGESRLLDLCSGLGGATQWLAGEVAHIHAVDGSEALIEKARKFDNVSHRVGDVNHIALAPKGRVDHIVVGSAIQWIMRDAMERIARNYMKPGGSIVIAESSYDTSGQPFAEALANLERELGRKEREIASDGTDKLNAIRFVRRDAIDISRKASVGYHVLYADFLLHATADFYDTPPEDSSALRKKFVDALDGHMDDGKVSVKVVNTARIFRREN